MKRSMASRILVSLGLASALLGASSLTLASGFQLWEQNGAGTGDYHAGAAADANDASTAFYNPAGLTRLKGPQVVAGSAFVNLITTFKGDMTFSTSVGGGSISQKFTNIRASGGVLKAVPFGYFAMPINQKLAVGFGILAPFGLETDYSRKTPLRYAATKTQLQIIDFTPNIAYQITRAFSLGAGLDFLYGKGTFDQVGGIAGGAAADTQSDNWGTGYGYGYHLGGLYQFTPGTRVGLAYHSQVFLPLKGTSTFTGPLANGNASDPNGVQKSKHLKTSVTLPPYLVLSGIYAFNPRWTALGSVTYTWWSSFNRLRLKNVAAFNGSTFKKDNTLIVNVLEKYSNTWNFAVGAHYSPTRKLTFKAGAGYDKTPTNGRYRNVQLPGQTHYVLAVGIHYQLLKTLGVDAGYAHFFVKDAKINNTQVVGSEIVAPNGVSRTSLNIYALQLTWDV